MQRFSGFSLLKRGLSGHRDWQPQWRKAEPKAAYDAVIVGGGGHGLGAAYYLAKEHGLTNVAVLEKGWIGGGNTGRNTTIIRSNYLRDESAALYDHALKMWPGLSQDLNYNVMFSPRGVMMLAHTVHDVQVFKRHVHANRANGVDNEWLTPEEARAVCPLLQLEDIRYPVLGARFPEKRRHCAPRCGRVGLCPRGGCARRRHHRELRGHRHPPRYARRGAGARDDPRPHPGAQGGSLRCGPLQRHPEDGGCAVAARELPAAGAGLRAGQADLSLRGHVQHHPRLHQPVRQGRARDRRGYRRLHFVYPAWRPAHHQPCARGHLRALPHVPAHADAAQLGRYRRCQPGSLADASPGRRYGACT